MAARFGFIPVTSGFLPSEAAFDQIIGDYILALERLGGERWSDETLDKPACLFYLVVTGGTEEAILNSLLKATATTGFSDHKVQAIPIEQLVEICRRYGVIAP